MRLANKVAIITGSAGGMGKAAAELFAREGANIVVTDMWPLLLPGGSKDIFAGQLLVPLSLGVL